MRLNLSSLSFNLQIDSGGGTPAWGTELGQGSEYKFLDGLQDFLTAMLYKAVPNVEDVYCPLGKGGNQRDDYDFVVASIFDKVYVNNELVDDAKMLLLVVRKRKGDFHVGRCTLKYNPKMTYEEKEINKKCYELIAQKLGVNPKDGAWFVDEIHTKNQDELHLTAYIGGSEPISFRSVEERKNFYLDKIKKNHPANEAKHSTPEQEITSLQAIYYGAPGTGKSYKIKRLEKGKATKPIRTTFHPDSDYATFVGAYKPTMEIVPRYDSSTGNQVEEKRIAYNYVPQAFLKAYVQAWRNYPEPQYLVIEEINRGNCAQIFGDLFQLLDRSASGFSEYPIAADSDISKYLLEVFSKEDKFALTEEQRNEINALYKGEYADVVADVQSGELLLLPKNLHILATMNTSDQSLFPIDSAFKRRWEWEYVPIRNANKGWVIAVDGKEWDWWSFLMAINAKIGSVTDSEDKKLGYFFVKPSDNHTITAETFVSKVIFYLWNDVFKDYGFSDEEFQTKDGKGMSFPMFYETENEDQRVNEALIAQFLQNVVGNATEVIQEGETAIDEA